MFLEISQNSQESMQSLFFNKVAGLWPNEDSDADVLMWILRNL